MVGIGLTTVPISDQILTQIRARIANPAHAAALATLLFAGATYRELTELHPHNLIADTIIFTANPDRSHPADLGVWVIPPQARALFRAAIHFQQAQGARSDLLFAGAIGTTGTLPLAARTCHLQIPALHPWRDGWLRSTGMRNLAETPHPA